MSESPDRLPRRNSRFLRALGRSILWATGWRSEGQLPNIPQFVACVAPHTSNWDFVNCAAYMCREDLKLSFLGKHTLFFWPMSLLMRGLGGFPVNRKAPTGIVGGVIDMFANHSPLIVALAPEGTRRAARFRPGFIHMALGAKVPILLVTLDNARRVIVIGELFTPTGNVDADLAQLVAHYAQFQTTRHVK